MGEGRVKQRIRPLDTSSVPVPSQSLKAFESMVSDPLRASPVLSQSPKSSESLVSDPPKASSARVVAS